MELLDWIRVGLRGGFLVTWFVVLFKIQGYFATDTSFKIWFWLYLVLHVSYAGMITYKEIDEDY